MFGYFTKRSRWDQTRKDILKAIRDAYEETQRKPWLSLSRSRRLKREGDSEERLRLLREDLSEHEHTKPERPDDTRELFDYLRRDEND